MDLEGALNELIGLLLPGWNSLIATWYDWGIFVSLVIALLVVFWVFVAAARRSQDATIWKVLSLLAVVLVAPALVIRVAPALVLPQFLSFIVPAAYLGLCGTVLSVVVFLLFSIGVGAGQGHVCPTCGRRLDPTWDRCPYCQPAYVAPPQPEPEAPPMPTVPFEAPTGQVGLEGMPVGGEPMRGPDKTTVIKKETGPMAWLVVTSGPRAGTQFRLGESIGIGRDPGLNEVVIDDQAMSRQHAKIRLDENGQFVIHDLASTNHTYVNGEEVYRHVLANDDRIKMGETNFAFMTIGQKKASEE